MRFLKLYAIFSACDQALNSPAFAPRSFVTTGRAISLFHKRSAKCRDEHGRWDCGSGRLHFGEDLTACVLREIEEEYGCRGIIDEALPPLSVVREHNSETTHWIAHPFIVRVNPSEIKNNDPEKIDEFRWFTLDELPTPLHSGSRRQLERDQARFAQYASGHELRLPKE